LGGEGVKCLFYTAKTKINSFPGVNSVAEFENGTWFPEVFLKDLPNLLFVDNASISDVYYQKRAGTL
jgi:hypothetical protein